MIRNCPGEMLCSIEIFFETDHSLIVEGVCKKCSEEKSLSYNIYELVQFCLNIKSGAQLFPWTPTCNAKGCKEKIEMGETLFFLKNNADFVIRDRCSYCGNPQELTLSLFDFFIKSCALER
jgi:hypothetical protein